MSKLAEVGFSQSYTYFTWRLTKQELTGYMAELAWGPKSDYMRANFWPNTPDILSGPLREGGPPAFKQRLILAGTLSPTYGIYSGYELCENAPASKDDEEYLYSEKYEIKDRDWSAAGNLSGYIARLNQIRRNHPCFHQMANLQFHATDNDQVIAYSKWTRDRTDRALVVVNLNPNAKESANVSLERSVLGFGPEQVILAEELLAGTLLRWEKSDFSLDLSPDSDPAAVFSLDAADA